MEDFPRTAGEFNHRFGTEEACWEYLVGIRWPNGYICPRCQGKKAWVTERKLFHCSDCDHEGSATSGTILQDTRKPLRLWFQAMWWVVGQKTGASALGLNRVLGIGTYKTAWTWLHKLRRAMVRPRRDRLSGEVEVDETFVGGVEEGGGRRHIGKKALVAIAAEVRGKGIGRIRMQRIQDSSGASLVPFVQAAICEGSEVITDGLQSYRELPSHGYRHRRLVIQGGEGEASTLLPRVHRVASLVKRWLLGTHQGAVSREHLDYYLDEFTFRFNRRSSRHRGKLFYRLLEQAVQVEPTPYEAMIKHARGPKAGKHNV